MAPRVRDRAWSCRSLQAELGRWNGHAVELYRSLDLAPHADDRITLTGPVPRCFELTSLNL